MPEPLGIISGIDNENQVRIEAKIIGIYKTTTYGCILDTGYSGTLVLPLTIAVELGLEKAGMAQVTLADGSTSTVPTFICKVDIGGTIQEADTLVLGSEVLLGMGIMEKYQVMIDSGAGKVSFSPSTRSFTTTQKKTVAYTKQNNIAEILKKLTGR